MQNPTLRSTTVIHPSKMDNIQTGETILYFILTNYESSQIYSLVFCKKKEIMMRERDIHITFGKNPVLLRLAFYLYEVSIHCIACVLYNCK